MALALLVLFYLSASVQAINDWSAPCHSGSCAYDVRNATSSSSVVGASLFINGSTSAISDLTPSGGWDILDCDAEVSAQDIRAICTGDNAACKHLYENGAVGTIVRLPDNCAQMPFARVVDEWVHDNQSIPTSVMQKLRGRDIAQTTVRGITIDTDFHAIDPDNHGPVFMSIQGGTYTSRENPTLHARQLDTRDSIASDKLIPIHPPPTTFDFSDSGTSPLSVIKDGAIANNRSLCAASATSTAYDAGLGIQVTTQAEVTLDYGVTAQGTLIPPLFNQISLVVGLVGTIDNVVNVDALGSVELVSGQISLFEESLPGLEISGILTLDPTFKIIGQVEASFTGSTSMFVKLTYQIPYATILFHAGASIASGRFVPNSTELQLAADPTVLSNGTIDTHVAPAFVFNMNGLGLQGDISLNIDSAASLSMLSVQSPMDAPLAGCAAVSSDLSVTAAASNTLFELFELGPSVSLLSDVTDLWQNCGSGISRREHPREFNIISRAAPQGVSCAGGSSNTRNTMVSEVIPAAA